MLPVRLPELFAATLREQRRPPDGLLHASSDLVGPLRHAQLRAAGAPERPSALADDVVLMTGTLWHSWAHEALVRTGLPFMQEVKLGRYMPEGWTGTADWVFWNPELNGFVLGDMKTIKGDGITWIQRDGAKREHLWQLSCYWHALVAMGLPMVQGFGVLYWPKDRGGRPDGSPQAVVQECEPLDEETIRCVMESRWGVTRDYLAQLPRVAIERSLSPSPEHYVNDLLAAETDRIQKVSWNKTAGVFDLKLVPHWSTSYCPFEPPLCECSLQGVTKLGHYDVTGEFHPRKGYEHHVPTERPAVHDIAKRRKEAA